MPVPSKKARVRAESPSELSNKNRFREIYDYITDAIFVLDDETCAVIDVNEAASELFGFSRDELLRLDVSLANAGELHLAMQRTCQMAKSLKREPQVAEWHTRHKDGSLFWVEANMRAAEIGGRQRLLVTVRDITGRKRAAQVQLAYYRISNAALQSHSLDEFYRSIHSLIDELMPARNFYIALYDELYDIISYPYFVDDFDRVPEPHAPDTGLTTYVLRNQKPLRVTSDVLQEMIARGEVELLGADSYDWLGVPLRTQEKILGVLCVQTYRADERLTDEHKDVLSFVSTQVAMAIDRRRFQDSFLAIKDTLRNSENLYRRAIEAAGAVPYYQDYQADVYVFIGENIRQILGYSIDEFTPSLWQEVCVKAVPLGEGAKYDSHNAILQARAGKISIWQADNLVRTASGELRWIYDVAVEVLGADGRSKGSIGILQDVTDRKLAEEQILKMNEELERRVTERTAQLEQAIKEIESFSYSVSHDLRAPLRALNGYARILMTDFGEQVPPDAKKYLSGIDDNARQMGRLIDDILALSRLSRQPLNFQLIDQLDIIQRALHTLQPEMEDRNVDIFLPKSLETHGDPTLLYQVWLNLLGNALKFTRHRDPAKISVDTLVKDGETVFFVKDDGAGFDMKYASKLFGVFQRLHRAEDFEGTGVGLAIVQRVIHRHGGRIWAESQPGQGATFYFTLPGVK